jgi:predicted ester cyclase
MTRDEMAAFFERRRDAMSRHDSVELARQHSEDGIVESPLAGGSAQGREALEKVNQSFFHAFPDVAFRQEALLIDGDSAVLLLHLSGTDLGGLMGLAPTGRSFTIPMVFLDEFKDGVIARERRIYDFTGLLVQVGAIKAKPV